MKLIQIGDTTYSSDPKHQHKSYTVYTTAGGKSFYTKCYGRWYYAFPEYPTGFRIGKPVPRNLIPLLNTGRYR